MGVYGTTSTWYQGVSPTPPAHPAPASFNCQALPTVSVSPLNSQKRAFLGKDYNNRAEPVFPEVTPGPRI